MTRERFEQILFAHVSDEVVQDMLNQYVLELESSNAKLRELVRGLLMDTVDYAESQGMSYDDTDMFALSMWQRADLEQRAHELGIEVDV